VPRCSSCAEACSMTPCDEPLPLSRGRTLKGICSSHSSCVAGLSSEQSSAGGATTRSKPEPGLNLQGSPSARATTSHAKSFGTVCLQLDYAGWAHGGLAASGSMYAGVTIMSSTSESTGTTMGTRRGSGPSSPTPGTARPALPFSGVFLAVLPAASAVALITASCDCLVVSTCCWSACFICEHKSGPGSV